MKASDLVVRRLEAEGVRYVFRCARRPIARKFATYRPNGCTISYGLAAMGIVLPGGIASALATPGRVIVTATKHTLGRRPWALAIETARR